jgi:hypothetical protein
VATGYMLGGPEIKGFLPEGVRYLYSFHNFHTTCGADYTNGTEGPLLLLLLLFFVSFFFLRGSTALDGSWPYQQFNPFDLFMAIFLEFLIFIVGIFCIISTEGSIHFNSGYSEIPPVGLIIIIIIIIITPWPRPTTSQNYSIKMG